VEVCPYGDCSLDYLAAGQLSNLDIFNLKRVLEIANYCKEPENVEELTNRLPHLEGLTFRIQEEWGKRGSPVFKLRNIG
jgi:hypothetical protein